MNFVVIIGVVLSSCGPFPEVNQAWRTTFRTDLQLGDKASITLVSHQYADDVEAAITLVSNEQKHRLMSVWRRPKDDNPNFHRWQVGEIDLFLVDGGGQLIVFEKEYDHRPTKSEIEQFVEWVGKWDVP